MSGEIPEAVVRHLHQPFVLKGAGSNHHHARRGVVRGNVVLQLLPREAAHVLRRPEDGATQPALLEADFVEVVQDHLPFRAARLGYTKAVSCDEIMMYRGIVRRDVDTYRSRFVRRD